jgi:hypothetical protein
VTWTRGGQPPSSGCHARLRQLPRCGVSGEKARVLSARATRSLQCVLRLRRRHPGVPPTPHPPRRSPLNGEAVAARSVGVHGIGRRAPTRVPARRDVERHLRSCCGESRGPVRET